VCCIRRAAGAAKLDHLFGISGARIGHSRLWDVLLEAAPRLQNFKVLRTLQHPTRHGRESALFHAFLAFLTAVWGMPLRVTSPSDARPQPKAVHRFASSPFPSCSVVLRLNLPCLHTLRLNKRSQGHVDDTLKPGDRRKERLT
jgi:hypothetical protein